MLSLCNTKVSAPKIAGCSLSPPKVGSVSCARAVITRCEPRSKMVREYREADDSLVNAVPSQQPKTTDGSMYVDDKAPPRTKPKDNLSKEMKDKLRKEYVAYGGAENKAMGSNGFLIIMGVMSVLAITMKAIGVL